MNGTARAPALAIAPAALAFAAWIPAASVDPQQVRPPTPDIHFVPTPTAIVDAMLKLARVMPTEVIYDLGPGDGRIVITAARRCWARAIGIEIDPELIKEAWLRPPGQRFA